MPSRRAALVVLALALLGAGCKGAPDKEDRLVVFAAASLRDVFTELGRRFERAHPGVAVTFNFAGTQELRTQVEHGAPADVLASADERHMDALRAAGHVHAPVVFSRNELVVVVAQGAALRSFAELPDARRVVVGHASVPVGHYTELFLERAAATLGADFPARVQARVASRELNARQVLAKVALGEADAGVVYRTDAGRGVRVVPIPPEANVVASYPIAVVKGAPHPGLARQWVELVLSAEGQAVLREAGFVPPASGGK